MNDIRWKCMYTYVYKTKPFFMMDIFWEKERAIEKNHSTYLL